MGFFDTLFGRSEPSDRWPVETGIPVVLDLDRHALCNVRIGDPVDWLAGVGRPEDRKSIRDGRYCYVSRGMEFDVTDGLIEGFVTVWVDETEQRFNPFPGTAVFRGRELRLGPHTREQELVSIFGEPYWRDRDDTEIILFYEFRDAIEWQVEFTLDGSLKEIIVTTPPLLSNPDQRLLYKVTKPWPPKELW